MEQPKRTEQPKQTEQKETEQQHAQLQPDKPPKAKPAAALPTPSPNTSNASQRDSSFGGQGKTAKSSGSLNPASGRRTRSQHGRH